MTGRRRAGRVALAARWAAREATLTVRCDYCRAEPGLFCEKLDCEPGDPPSTPWGGIVMAFLAERGFGGFLADVETVADVGRVNPVWAAFQSGWRDPGALHLGRYVDASRAGLITDSELAAVIRAAGPMFSEGQEIAGVPEVTW